MDIKEAIEFLESYIELSNGGWSITISKKDAQKYREIISLLKNETDKIFTKEDFLEVIELINKEYKNFIKDHLIRGLPITIESLNGLYENLIVVIGGRIRKEEV